MIEKIILRDQVSNWLQEQMLNGKVESGQKLSLVDISRDIDVSVTPIREALAQLVRAGIVQTISNRGFFVPKLSTKEAKNIYPAIYSLEKLALEQSTYSSEHLDKLDRIQLKFENAADIEDAVRFDLRFHEVLVENYDNEVIGNILRDLKVRVFFYELEYMKSSEHHSTSIATHRAIIEALREGETVMAGKLLQENWEISSQFIEQHYQEN